MDVMPVFVILLLAVPTVGAVIAALLGPTQWRLIRWVSLAATLIDLVIAGVLATSFVEHRSMNPPPPLKAGMTETFRPEFVPWADAKNPHKTTCDVLKFGKVGSIQFYLGLDGINVWLIVLTALLMVPAVLISWNVIQERANEYYAWLLALGTGMLGVFLAFDIILFYVFFELTLVPLFFLIGIWGGPDRRHAARKFFIYTLAGSLITFLGLLAVVTVCYLKTSFSDGRHLSFSIPELVDTMQQNLAAATDTDRAFWRSFQTWVFLALMAGFAIKVPLVPFHTWLPLAHVEAPTAGSVLLAGVLLKLGAYGFLRFCLPLTPDACIRFGLPLISTLAVIGIIGGAFCALAQSDIKKLVAYSSVSHLGLCMLGMFALNSEGLAGSLLQMINHGLSTGALFLLVGMLYERYHTRQFADYGGMGSKLGLMSACMVFITLSSIGLPGLNGFVSEALIFFGMYRVQPVFAIVGTAGILLGAWYMLTMVKQVFFGTLKEPHHEGTVGDLDGREICALAPIMVLCVVLGLYPQAVLDSAKPDLDVVANILKVARDRAGTR
jgi:NADH-quinone oxidoreductase subunit M